MDTGYYKTIFMGWHVESSFQVLCLSMRTKLNKEEFLNQHRDELTIVIDCEFDDYATDKEIKSLVNQLMQSYGMYRRSAKPFNMIICGIEKESNLYNALNRISGIENWLCQLKYEKLETLFDANDLTYLSADATEILEDIVPNGIYVIGGIVDHNRLNRITYNKAKYIGANCKRFPIKEHVNLNCSNVLSITACVSILIEYYKHNNWKVALSNSIPKRKLVTE